MIFGPPAVGKMTVGVALSRFTGLPLFHNHMTVELVHPFFSVEDPRYRRLVDEFRIRIFQEVACSAGPGIIFTFTWDMSDPHNKERVDGWTSIFRERGARIFYVELAAPLEVRLARNREPSRLELKPSKRDVAVSEAQLLESDRLRKLNSDGGFYYPDLHLRIENAYLSPKQVASQIQNYFGLTSRQSSIS